LNATKHLPPVSAEFRTNIEIPWKQANSAALLKILHSVDVVPPLRSLSLYEYG